MNLTIRSSIEKTFNKLQDSEFISQKQIMNHLLEDPEILIDLTPKHIKTLISLINSPKDIIREQSAELILICLSECESVEECLEHLLQMLLEKTNCQDLENVLNMPEAMRPIPSQKPTVVIALGEKSEEVRLVLCDILKDLMDTSPEDFIMEHMSDFVNITRALLMDPSPDIRVKACKMFSSFVGSHTEALENFSAILCRALLLPLASKKSKLQIAALKALRELMYVGVFKTSVSHTNLSSDDFILIHIDSVFLGKI